MPTIAGIKAGIKAAATGANLMKGFAGLAIALSLFFGGKAWFGNFKDNIYTEGYNKAVIECNVTGLESALTAANERADEAERRAELAIAQKETLEEGKQDLIRFMGSLDRELETLESGDISPRTEKFLLIMNERNQLLIENEKAPTE